MATKKHPIQIELTKALGVKRSVKASDQTFYKKLVEVAQDIDEEAWDDLSSESQQWINDAGEALDSEEPLPAFDEIDSNDEEPEEEEDVEDEDDEEEPEEEEDEEEEEEEFEDEDEDDEEEPEEEEDEEEEEESGDDEDEDEDWDEEEEEEEEEEPAPKRTPRKGAKAKKAEADAPRTRASRGVTGILRQFAIKHPTWSVDRLLAAMEKKGHTMKRSTAVTNYNMLGQTVDSLREAGLIDFELKGSTKEDAVEEPAPKKTRTAKRTTKTRTKRQTKTTVATSRGTKRTTKKPAAKKTTGRKKR